MSSVCVFTFCFYFWFFWEHREKKFVTFEKTNSFKRGEVLAGFVGLVTIITGVECLGGSGRRFVFSKVKIFSPSEDKTTSKGTEVKIVGRVQSRTYEKKYDDGRVETKVAYEVSVSSLEVVNQDDNSNENEENEKQAI